MESNSSKQVELNIGDEDEIDITSPESIKLNEQRKARELWRKAKLNTGIKDENDEKAAKGSSWSFFRDVYEKKEIKFGLNKIATYKKFATRVYKSKKDLFNIFNKIKKKNKTIVGYGATAKSTTVLNFCDINSNFENNFVYGVIN
jgi:hypothetical protein